MPDPNQIDPSWKKINAKDFMRKGEYKEEQTTLVILVDSMLTVANKIIQKK